MSSPPKILSLSSAQAASAGLVQTRKTRNGSTQLWSLVRLLISQKVSVDPDGVLLGNKS